MSSDQSSCTSLRHQSCCLVFSGTVSFKLIFRPYTSIYELSSSVQPNINYRKLPPTMSHTFAPSIGGSLSDLDGYSLAGDSCYATMQPSMYHDNSADFGFDPPNKQTMYPVKLEQMYSPPEEDSPFNDFEFDPKAESTMSSPQNIIQLDRMISQSIPNAGSAVSRYGQFTPPRSNSESSVEKPAEAKQPRQRRSTKPSIKEETPKSSQAGRKRKNSRKTSVASLENPEEDDKRKQSLEKNRLAAAKCRVNKKEKTEQLQRDSHDKAVENAFLKEQVMRMKEEVQQMNALLLAHANCEGCKSPDDIQKHLNNLGNEFLAHHMSGMGHEYPSYPHMPLEMEMEHDQYFPSAEQSLLNPPLPEFTGEAEFESATPMHTD